VRRRLFKKKVTYSFPMKMNPFTPARVNAPKGKPPISQKEMGFFILMTVKKQGLHHFPCRLEKQTFKESDGR